MISISNEIKAGRQKIGLTQQNMANKLNISLVTYIKYENNPLSMELRVFIKMCEILGEEFLNIFFTKELYKMYKKEFWKITTSIGGFNEKNRCTVKCEWNA